MEMTDILRDIVANKRREVAAKASLGLYRGIEDAVGGVSREPVSMSGALVVSPSGIIAEFKRRSPSKGGIHPQAAVDQVVGSYEAGGAAACSILTDTPYFGGALSDLALARRSTALPLLRKEFIVDERQLFESRLYGADAVLLIASALTVAEIGRLVRTAHEVGLEVLLELHGQAELDKMADEVDMVGVNNRNLSDFSVNVDESARLASLLPAEVVKVAESGLTSMSQVDRLRAAGYQGFLIGERFMRASDPGNALNEFINGDD